MQHFTVDQILHAGAIMDRPASVVGSKACVTVIVPQSPEKMHVSERLLVRGRLDA
jgi:hypothetical protein